jgi:hypothetical protein
MPLPPEFVPPCLPTKAPHPPHSRTAPLLFLCLLVLLTLSARGALADDEQVWAALKQGGKVVLLRHPCANREMANGARRFRFEPVKGSAGDAFKDKV